MSGYPSNKLFIVIITKFPEKREADSLAEFYGTSNNFKLTFITSCTKFIFKIYPVSIIMKFFKH